MDLDDLTPWLRLSLSHGIGNDAARRLLNAFGSPQAVFEQTEASLRQVVSANQSLALLTEPNDLRVQITRTQQWLKGSTSAQGRAIWCLGDAAYPQALLQLADPPLMVYVQGQLQRTLGNALSVVGSRNPTPQGAQTAQDFAHSLSREGLCIVSGLALGIDGAAHLGALQGAQTKGLRGLSDQQQTAHDDPWRTVAVVGTGLDRVYPRQHHALAQQICEQGLMMSEYALGSQPHAHHFPQRNRLIAALGLGCLVVEAAKQSGSLITAQMALELGREVMAIPGSIHSPQSHGCHHLIRQGAKLVETANDVLEELQLSAAVDSPALSTHEDDASPLLKSMGFTPVSLDALLLRNSLDTATLQAELLGLELSGQIARLPGGLFQRLNNG